MIEAWSVRIRRLMNAMGWPTELMALKLGLVSHDAVTRLLRGGRPSIDVLARLQSLEQLHAGEIEKQKAAPSRRIARSHTWPPDWIECRKRWWIERHGDKPTTRPADLAALDVNRTNPEIVLTGRFDPANFPGRVLKVVDWTPAGRRRYAEDRAAAARKVDDARRKRTGRTRPVNFRRPTQEK